MFLFYGCIDPFEPSILQSENRYLVVEGALIYGGDLTTIKLSRTANLSDSSFIRPVVGASVSVFGQDGTNQILTPSGDGEYSSTLILNLGENYYLSIFTEEGSYYRSDFVSPLLTPAIDSINWKKNDINGLEIYVNTHDYENNSPYYKWDFVETWEFNAPYQSSLEYVDDKIIRRTQENQIFTCWQYNESTSIILGSTAALSENIVYQALITSVPFDIKLSKKYSILINQHTLTKEAYFYLKNMKKNSEQLGSFYDAQPTEIRGNLYAVNNPKEPVIGYIYATAIAKKRIFVTYNDLDYFYRDKSCPDDALHILGSEDKRKLFGEGAYVPLFTDKFLQVIYTFSYCGDCRARGSDIRPVFWE